MFTGIVEELGTVRAVTPNAGGARLVIEASTVLDDVVLGGVRSRCHRTGVPAHGIGTSPRGQ